MVKHETVWFGNVSAELVSYVSDPAEDERVRAQLTEEYVDLPGELAVDVALSSTDLADDTDADIEGLAHLCREDYLYNVRKNDPDLFIRGAAGADGFISEMIEKEACYESCR